MWRIACGNWFSPSWDPGIKLRVVRLDGKCHYPLSHLNSPQMVFTCCPKNKRTNKQHFCTCFSWVLIFEILKEIDVLENLGQAWAFMMVNASSLSTYQESSVSWQRRRSFSNPKPSAGVIPAVHSDTSSSMDGEEPYKFMEWRPVGGSVAVPETRGILRDIAQAQENVRSFSLCSHRLKRKDT